VELHAGCDGPVRERPLGVRPQQIRGSGRAPGVARPVAPLGGRRGRAEPRPQVPPGVQRRGIAERDSAGRLRKSDVSILGMTLVRVLWTALALGAGTAALHPQAALPQPQEPPALPEYVVKAGFLFNFAKYVE